MSIRSYMNGRSGFERLDASSHQKNSLLKTDTNRFTFKCQ